MTIAPEVIAEQVMGYVVGANEMIPTLKPPLQPYTIAILPQGPHFYTGLLQAAGYLLLNSGKKKMIILSEQYDDIKHMLVDTNGYGPVFGKTRKNSISILSGVARQLKAMLARPEQTALFENIRFQLPFIRVIMEMDQILHIGIGPQISQTDSKTLSTWIKKHISEYVIVCLQNMTVQNDKNTKKSNEQHKIAKMITDPKTKASHLIQIFREVSEYVQQKPEIIAYVNPGDFGRAEVSDTRYVCAVA